MTKDFRQRWPWVWQNYLSKEICFSLRIIWGNFGPNMFVGKSICNHYCVPSSKMQQPFKPFKGITLIGTHSHIFLALFISISNFGPSPSSLHFAFDFHSWFEQWKISFLDFHINSSCFRFPNKLFLFQNAALQRELFWQYVCPLQASWCLVSKKYFCSII